MEMYIDDGGSEDTISLCDLQVSDDADDSEYYTGSHQSSITSFDQDFFGFFTQEYYVSDQTDVGSNYNYNPPVISSSTPLPENIIFCGKLIPTQKPEPAETKPINNLIFKQKSICRRLFRWNSDNLFHSRRSRSSAASEAPISTSRSKSLPVDSRSGFNNKSNHSRNDIYAKRAPWIFSLPTTSKLSSSRWFLFMFGPGRVPTRMELSDLRSRQLKRSPSTMFGWNNEDVEGNAGRRSGKGLLWWWISVLGCNGGYIHGGNDDVKSSFGCISQV